MTDRTEQPLDLEDDTPPWERQQPQAAEPEVGTSPLAKELEQDGTLQKLATRQTVERRNAEDEAHHASSKALFGDWDTLDDKGRTDWIKGEKDYTRSAEGWWRSIKDNIADSSARNLEEAGLKTGEDPTWLQRKVDEQIAWHKQRQQTADLMESGLKEAPKTGAARAVTDATARGTVDSVVANTLKGLAFADAAWDTARSDTPMNLAELRQRHRDLLAEGKDVTSVLDATPMGKVKEKALYKVGQDVSDWANARFPKDEARANEFKMQFGEGLGSMIGFMGPSAALSIANFGMRRAGLSLLPDIIASVASPGVVAGTTGAMSQVGSMGDDALKAFEEGKTVDGRRVDESDIFSTALWAGPIGATEAFPIAHLFHGQKGAWVRHILAQAYEEGGQEFGQQVAENVVARAHSDDKRQWDDNAWDGMAIGGLLGAKSQAIADVYRLRRGTIT